MNSNFRENEAHHGGAVYCSNSDMCSILKYNKATHNGGGISLHMSYVTVMVSN